MLSIVEETGVAREAKVAFIDAASVRAAKDRHAGGSDGKGHRGNVQRFKRPHVDPDSLRAGGQEVCVIDLARFLGLTGSAVSHQLRRLRGQRLVKCRKEGKIAYYSLDDDHIRNLLEECIKHVSVG